MSEERRKRYVSSAELVAAKWSRRHIAKFLGQPDCVQKYRLPSKRIDKTTGEVIRIKARSSYRYLWRKRTVRAVVQEHGLALRVPA